MSESYSPDGTFPTFPLTLPVDGELVTKVTLCDAILKKLINAVGWSKTIPSGQHQELSSRSITRVQTAMPIRLITPFEIAPFLNNQLKQDESLLQPVLVPHGVTITGWTISLTPDAHGVGMPDTRINCTLVKRRISTAVESDVHSPLTDPNTTAGSYGVLHEFSKTGLTEVVDRTDYLYYLRIVGETGTNDEDGQYNGAKITYTTTYIDDGY